MVEREGFEPSKAEPADLQSDPFGHSGTSPQHSKFFMVPLVGLEPTTYWLQVSCSTRWAKAALNGGSDETRTRDILRDRQAL